MRALKGRAWALFLAIIGAAVLWAAPVMAAEYTATLNEIEYTVSWNEGQTGGVLAAEGDQYGFTYSPTGQGYEVEFTYPDGSIWYCQSDNGGGSFGWSDGYDPESAGYLPGDTLEEMLVHNGPASSKNGVFKNIFPALLLIAAGAILLIAPRGVWYLETGWRFKGAEPSDMALAVNRFLGGVLLVVAIVLFFVL